jgi:hypothetical protein
VRSYELIKYMSLSNERRGALVAQALNSKLTENIRDMRKMCNSMAQFPAQLPPLQALSDLVNTLDVERADLLSAQAFIRSAARSLESTGHEAALPGWLATTDQARIVCAPGKGAVTKATHVASAAGTQQGGDASEVTVEGIDAEVSMRSAVAWCEDKMRLLQSVRNVTEGSFMPQLLAHATAMRAAIATLRELLASKYAAIQWLNEDADRMVVLGGELETLVAAAAQSSAAVAESEAAASQRIAQSAYVIQAGLKKTTAAVVDTAAAQSTVTWADVAATAQRDWPSAASAVASADAAGVAVGALLALLRARGSLEQGMVRAWRGAELTLPDDAALRVSAEEALHSHHHKVAQLKEKLVAAERAAAVASAEVRVSPRAGRSAPSQSYKP